jgi:beta-galactosidase/beta-glucuronidase
MVFNVNGVSLWCRGANLVPMDQLEGRTSLRSYQWTVESAVRANMNMLRVWGGGLIPPPEFYDACDEHGVLVYQDLMFVEEDGHGAFEGDPVRQEILHVVRRLSHHPSIVVWNGCNECANGDIYASFVMKTVAEADDTRPIWPNSPSSYGWESGVHTEDGKPNGGPLRIRDHETGAAYRLESHGTSRSTEYVFHACEIDSFVYTSNTKMHG